MSIHRWAYYIYPVCLIASEKVVLAQLKFPVHSLVFINDIAKFL